MEIKKYRILVASVFISGLSQGMLLPVLAILLEEKGVASSINGIHATGLSIGVLLISPFLEKPMRKYGYKPILILGGAIVTLSLLSFPIKTSIAFWFVLRLLIGVGDHMLHYSAQTWITSAVSPSDLGKKLSYYGLSFGCGFMIGPAMTSLLQINEALPFIISGALSISMWIIMLFITNDMPAKRADTHEDQSSFKRYKAVFILGWAVLLAPLGYGILEATINSNFPVYALRSHFSIEQISSLVPAVAFGGIVTQLPLGALSDRIGGKKVVPGIMGIGGILFFITSLFEGAFLPLWICLFMIGMVLGSTFSLGLKYMSELIPYDLLPTSNMLFGVAFSIGSMLGPVLGGFFIDYFNNISLFSIIGVVFMSFFILTIIFEKQQKNKQAASISG